MPFVKILKTKAYFKRYQVKFRRRKEGKTDYQARKRLIVQAKDKYNTPTYRLVVRFTNTDVICQIIYARINGDYTVVSAYSHELPRYGIKVGLTNWAASYATGLLCARRLLHKLKMDKKFEGVLEADGEHFETEPCESGSNPFKVFLDLGLRRSTTGAKVFAVMKGASDGGILVPHSDRRFPGYDVEAGEGDPEVLRNYIFGGHVANYMRELEEEEPERYERQFSRFIKAGIKADDLEEIYKKAHAAIRANPDPVKTEKKVIPKEKRHTYKQHRITYAERKQKIADRIAAARAAAAE